MEILIGLAAVGGALALTLLQSKPIPTEDEALRALKKLETSPDDPDANLIVGKYEAFVLGDYKAGMPHLAKSKDKTLKALAEHELDPLYTNTPTKKVVMGDEWVAAAKNFKTIYRIFYDRASQWYGLAWPDVDALSKEALRERAKKVSTLPAPGTPKKGLPAGWTSNLAKPPTSIDPTVAHIGMKSLRIDMERPKPEVFWIASPFIEAPKGPVVFSAWLLTDGTDSAQDRIVLDFVDKVGGGLGSKTEIFVSKDFPFWKKLESKVNIPDGAARMNVGIILHSTKGVVWIDDFSVKFDKKELIENGSFEK